ncbi:MAG: L-threonylcarbamoyladenylate synthase [Roseibium sp.]
MQRWTPDMATPGWQQSDDAGKVSDALKAGDLVAVPTETVYGLAADATSSIACAKIFAAKGRPSFNPLISHVPSLEVAQQHGVFNEQALKLAKAFWPGPLTLVVPKAETSTISELATAGLKTVALRVPAGPVMRFLAEATGRPLAAPSANRSGKISATCADDVIADLRSSLSYVVDTGFCEVGIESTIIGLFGDQPRLLRPGGLSREDIETVLGSSLQTHSSEETPDAPSAPGMLTSHYAPDAIMVLDAEEITFEDALLSFGSSKLPGAEKATKEINLSPSGDMTEAASNLFQAMRTLDNCGAKTIRVQHIPNLGLGEAINDRLRRAAAPRD